MIRLIVFKPLLMPYIGFTGLSIGKEGGGGHLFFSVFFYIVGYFGVCVGGWVGGHFLFFSFLLYCRVSRSYGQDSPYSP